MSTQSLFDGDILSSGSQTWPNDTQLEYSSILEVYCPLQLFRIEVIRMRLFLIRIKINIGPISH